MKKLLASFFIFGLFYFIAAPVSKIQAATNTFECKWNLTSCRAEAESYADCNDGYEVDSDYCTAITDKESCQSATDVACVSGDSTTTSSTTASSGTWYNQSFQEWSSKVYDNSNPNEIFGERYTAAQVQWIFYSIYSFIINSTSGEGSVSAIQCLLNGGTEDTCILEDVSNSESFLKIKNNIIAGSDHANTPLLAAVFADDRPFSGISYTKGVFQKLQPVKSVKAQTNDMGVGFQFLEVVQNMWVAVRNMAYILFVIAAIVLSFMVMFRVKISPQVVITIQSAIPKILIALVLVTFSYAIAGFLIDLMYVVIGLISIFAAPIVKAVPGSEYGDTSAAYVFSWLTNGPDGKGVFALVANYLTQFSKYFSFGLAIYIKDVLKGFGDILSVGVIVYIILLIIITIMTLVTSIKIVWKLTKACAQIFLLTIAAPLQITAGIIISNLGFASWLKSFVSSLAVFVITGVLFLLAYIFLLLGIENAFPNGFGAGLLRLITGSSIADAILGTTNQALSSSVQLPLLGLSNNSLVVGLIFMAVSFVVFTLIPKATEIVQGFITGKPFAYGSAIGEAFGPAKWAWGQTGAPYLETARKVALEDKLANWTTRVKEALKNKKPKVEGGT